MTKLVLFAEDGNILETYRDVPEFIRDLIYAKEEQRSERKLKRKAISEHLEGSPPIKIIHVLPSSCAYRHDSPPGSVDIDTDSSVVAPVGRTRHLCIPEPRDKAIHTYCQWHCGRVIGVEWKKGF